ncbi:uncharacterized protein PHALS_14092 [Plasmopara halstedii]|uniref:Uncharacterized protein n=1 Tax=Plasmopara halstedii TaxID=4781 RepID=A0A0P1ARS6_PLAHL|nr:uncharacterized protein PHALS_14092 [Plasmopara halstedii]CEG43801.1 hypothetical protein PHALS_14092 [Plasmopara halstedii]|eukprot:XP_024580170.1 hypothetical protein PHALS_14092 [Plasmopara halstedii]
MVQTVTLNEATLVECMAKFVTEDLRALNGETSWWHQRVRLVEHWLRDETSRVIMPSDGTEEMIRRHIQRGDSHPQAQCKCWKYIVMELRDLTCFAGLDKKSESLDCIAPSPSRGKLRPGKDLIVLDDEKCTESSSSASVHGDNNVNNNLASSWSLEPLDSEGKHSVALKRPRPISSIGYMSRREVGIDTLAVGKRFAEMSLLERQVEWLRKKQEKTEAERLRQTAENERELTFRPKLIRRITYSGDKYFRDSQSALPSSRSITRSESSRNLGETREGLLKERIMPKVPRLSTQKRFRKKTALQIASQFQPVEVPCKLLDCMKLELQASLVSSRKTESEIELAASEGNNAVYIGADDMSSHEGNDEELQVLDNVSKESKPEENVPAWSGEPKIGGRRADLDSSETKVRLILQDASEFELSTMYRKTDRKAGRDGVALHVGRREDTLEEQVIAVLFDREKVTEEEAERWWADHQHRFAGYIKPKQSDG